MKIKKNSIAVISMILIALSFFSFNDIRPQRFEYMTVAYRPFNSLSLFSKSKPSGRFINFYYADGTAKNIQMDNNNLTERTTLIKELNKLGTKVGKSLICNILILTMK